jgi:hypothetical protein
MGVYQTIVYTGRLCGSMSATSLPLEGRELPLWNIAGRSCYNPLGRQFCYILLEVSEHHVLVGDVYLYIAMRGELIECQGGMKDRRLDVAVSVARGLRRVT